MKTRAGVELLSVFRATRLDSTCYLVVHYALLYPYRPGPKEAVRSWPAPRPLTANTREAHVVTCFAARHAARLGGAVVSAESARVKPERRPPHRETGAFSYFEKCKEFHVSDDMWYYVVRNLGVSVGLPIAGRRPGPT